MLEHPRLGRNWLGASFSKALDFILLGEGPRLRPWHPRSPDHDLVLQNLAPILEKKDKKLAEKTKLEYLEYMDTVFTYFETLTRNLFGRDIPQVLLTHDSELNVESFEALLSRIEQRGYKFVSLEQALADPAYSTLDKYVGPEGISWLNRWKIAFGQDPDFRHNPDPPKWVLQASNDIRKAKSRCPPTRFASLCPRAPELPPQQSSRQQHTLRPAPICRCSA